MLKYIIKYQISTPISSPKNSEEMHLKYVTGKVGAYGH